MFVLTSDLVLYNWVYARFRVCELPTRGALTWLVALLFVDLCFYAFHRAAHGVLVSCVSLPSALREHCACAVDTRTWMHLATVRTGGDHVNDRVRAEVNVLWAAHQAHHSSEQYTLATALRKSVVQPFTQLVFYAPLALAVPPPVFYAHFQLNLLYQFYIHTEARHIPSHLLPLCRPT